MKDTTHSPGLEGIPQALDSYVIRGAAPLYFVVGRSGFGLPFTHSDLFLMQPSLWHVWLYECIALFALLALKHRYSLHRDTHEHEETTPDIMADIRVTERQCIEDVYCRCQHHSSPDASFSMHKYLLPRSTYDGLTCPGGGTPRCHSSLAGARWTQLRSS